MDEISVPPSSMRDSRSGRKRTRRSPVARCDYLRESQASNSSMKMALSFRLVGCSGTRREGHDVPLAGNHVAVLRAYALEL